MGRSTTSKKPESRGVKVIAEEVEDGLRYKGTITMGSKVFDFALKVPVSFALIEKRNDLTFKDVADHVMGTEIDVKSGGKPVQLSDDQKKFLTALGWEASHGVFIAPLRRGERDSGNFVKNLLDLTGGSMKFSYVLNVPFDLNAPFIKKLLRVTSAE